MRRPAGEKSENWSSAKISTMKRLALLLLCVAAYGQTTTITPTCPASIVAGQSASVTITLAGATGQNMVAVQCTMAPPAGSTIGTATAGAAVAAVPTDTLSANPVTGTILVAGTAAPVALADGVLATVPVTLTTIGTASLPLTGIIAATEVGTQGVSLNGVTAGAACSIKVLSPCAVTGDATVSVADIQAVVNAALGKTACSFPTFPACTVVEVVDVEIAAIGGACIIH